jgi:hypothetical protein
MLIVKLGSGGKRECEMLSFHRALTLWFITAELVVQIHHEQLNDLRGDFGKDL